MKEEKKKKEKISLMCFDILFSTRISFGVVSLLIPEGKITTTRRENRNVFETFHPRKKKRIENFSNIVN